MKHLKQPDPKIAFEPLATSPDAPKSFISEFVKALLNDKGYQGVVVPRAKPSLDAQIRYLGKLWTVGIVLMTAATWGMVRLEIFDRPGTAVMAYLLIIVVLSLMDSFVTSAIFSLISVACLDYFFIVPLHSFDISSTQDIVALVAFVVTSLVITTLVRRARRFGETQHEQAHLLDLTPDAILVLDVDRVITYWNRGAEKLFGWKRDEAIGKVAHVLLKTVYPAPLGEILETSGRAGRWEGQLIQTTKDGAKVFVESKWILRRDFNGNSIGALESNTDITARRHAEEALRESQAAYLSEAQRLSHTGSFGWHYQSGELNWSEESFRIFGYDKDIKPTLALAVQRIHPEDRERVRAALNRAIARKEPLDIEHRLKMPDGSIKVLHVVGRPLTDERGNIELIGAVMDMTSHKVAYDALENSELRYRHLFKFMPISLWKLDVRRLMEMFDELKAAGIADFPAYLADHPEFFQHAMNVIVAEEVNEATVRMFGARSQAELLGSVGRFFKQRPDTMVRILESRFNDAPLFEEKSQLVTLDGRLIDVLLTAARTEFGVTLAGLVELTDLVRTQERLERLQMEFAHTARVSTLGELTASIAHELNQPLGAIVTNCEAGLRWLDRPEPDLQEVYAAIRRSLLDAQRSADIIARIRAMAARRVPERVLMCPHDVILEALQFLRHEVEWRGITVSHVFAPEAPQVLADRTLLHQVIVNLAVNAMQAMAEHGTAERRITVRTSRLDGGSLRCSVEDSGPGIATVHLPHLFESFFSTKQGGMGMGLSICHSVIEAHGGRMGADNGSVHGGARFFFTLPAADETLQ
ncbi:PAS domain S-box protein [Bradyrhizobium sp. CER78]|uniref:PAS domain S-box protein n=1 Tax=Bradyrhizobium sp. CER78 TaxID=3039162 RepID=UPI0024473F27|nr:PAS domain S-box protein [Bradyrhizobium sp. CER78]MDH2385507.1 PAS domain S-box protein [Bradyrhizobium sp. CER78]